MAYQIKMSFIHTPLFKDQRIEKTGESGYTRFGKHAPLIQLALALCVIMTAQIALSDCF